MPNPWELNWGVNPWELNWATGPEAPAALAPVETPDEPPFLDSESRGPLSNYLAGHNQPPRYETTPAAGPAPAGYVGATPEKKEGDRLFATFEDGRVLYAQAEDDFPEGATAVEEIPSLLGQRGRQVAGGVAEVAAGITEGQAVTDAMFDETVRKMAPARVAEALSSLKRIDETLRSGNADPQRQKELLRVAEEARTTVESWQEIQDSGTTPADERAAFKRGDDIRAWAGRKFGVPDPNDKSFWGKAAQGLGTSIGFLAGAVVPVAGPALVAGAGGLMNAASLYKEAKSAGADETTALETAKWGFPVGASEAVPFFAALKVIPPAIRGRVTNRVLRAITEISINAGDEAAQETFQGVMNNIISSKKFDATRGVWDNVGEQALIGLLLGGGLGAGVAMVGATKGDDVVRRATERPAGQPENLQEPRTDLPPPSPDDISAPLQTQLVQAGREIIDKAVSGVDFASPNVDAAVSGVQPSAQTGGGVSNAGTASTIVPNVPDEEARVLRQAGWTAEDIADMNDEERVEHVQEAVRAGVKDVVSPVLTPPAAGTSAPTAGTAAVKPEGTGQSRPLTKYKISRADGGTTVLHVDTTPEFQAAAEAVKRDLRQQLDAMGLKGVKLEIPLGITQYDAEGNLTGESAAFFDPDRGFIAVAMRPDSIKAEGGRTNRQRLGHEALHALRSAMRPAEWSALAREVPAQYVQRAAAEYRGLSQEAQTEEAVAEWFGDWHDGSVPVKGFVRTAFERIKSILGALRSALQGQGFTTAKQVFRKLSEGEVGARLTEAAPKPKIITPASSGSGGAPEREPSPQVDRAATPAAKPTVAEQKAKLAARKPKKKAKQKPTPEATAKMQADFFSYKAASPTPTLEEAKAAKAIAETTTQKEWDQLTPGMKREIVRTAAKKSVSRETSAAQAKESKATDAEGLEAELQRIRDEQKAAAEAQRRLMDDLVEKVKVLGERFEADRQADLAMTPEERERVADRYRPPRGPRLATSDGATVPRPPRPVIERPTSRADREPPRRRPKLVPIKEAKARDSEEFKAWFGDSKVVDSNGEPMVMYHASTADFDAFNAAGMGEHFGTAAAANARARAVSAARSRHLKVQTLPGTTIYPVYLSIQNPLRLADLGEWHDAAVVAEGLSRDPRAKKRLDSSDLLDILSEAEETKSEYEGAEFPEDYDPFDYPADSSPWTISPENERLLRELRSMIEFAGWDGIIYRNTVEDAGNDSWIAFNPEQAKSPFNKGTFNPESPVMNEAKARDSEAFNRWFGNSKVVDKEGAPLVVYHGTTKDFDRFRRTKDDDGIFFTPSPDVARVYATGTMADTDFDDIEAMTGDSHEGARTIPVYLRAENPLQVTARQYLEGVIGLDGEGEQLFLFDERAIRAAGYDSLRILGDPAMEDDLFAHDNWVVFKPEQIKSVFNRGTFSPASPNMLEAKARPAERIAAANAQTGLQPVATTQAAFDTPEFGPGSNIASRLHDVHENLRATQKQIEKARGSPLPESLDAHLATEIYQTRTNADLKRLMREEVAPIEREMRLRKVDRDDLFVYLVAKHAPELNAEMRAEDYAKWGDHGSGVTDGAAQAMLNELAAEGKTSALEAVSKRIYKMLEGDLRRRRKAGLISGQDAVALHGKFKFYVPFGWAMRDDGTYRAVGSIGQGFDVRGPEARAKIAKLAPEFHPFTQSIAMAQEGIIRAEKNRVNQRLYRLAVNHPNDDFLKVVSDPGLDPNVISVKIGGKNRYVWAHPTLARTIKVFGQGSADEVVHFMRQMTNAYSRLQTTYNMAFWIPNLSADVLETFIKAFAEPGLGMLPVKFAKNMPGAMTSLMREAAGLGHSAAWDPIVKEWEAAGGKMEFMGFRDLADIERALGKASMADGKVHPIRQLKNAPEAVLNALETLAGPFENASRLAMYASARELGLSQDRAARMSLEASGGNYMKRGSWTPTLATLFPFFNAAEKGTAAFIRLAKNPRTAAIFATTPVIAGLQAMLWASMYPDPDDPDGVPLYFKVDPWERARSLIIPTGSYRDKDGIMRLAYRSIRLPYIIRPLWVMGDKVVEAALTPMSASEAAADVMLSAATAFNPVGGDDFMFSMTPLIGDPFLALWSNRTEFGIPIHPDSKAPGQMGEPVHSQTFNPGSTSTTSVWLAQALNNITGGDNFERGYIDIYPGQIDFMAKFVTGGLGRFVTNGVETAKNWVNDVPMDIRHVPVLGSLQGETSHFDEDRRFYDGIKTLSDSQKVRLRKMKSNFEDYGIGNWEDVQARAAEIGARVTKGKDINWDDSWNKIVDKAADKVADIRHEINATHFRDDISPAEKAEITRKLRAQIELVMRQARYDTNIRRSELEKR